MRLRWSYAGAIDPYRIPTKAPNRPAQDEGAKMLSSCTWVRASVPGDAFLKGLVATWPELTIVSDQANISAEDLVREVEDLPTPGQVLTLFALWETSTGVLCLDPSKSWWSELRMLERLSAKLGSIMCAMIDEPFASFGVRFLESGSTERLILRIENQLELKGKTRSEEVGIDVSELDTETTRALAGVPRCQNLSDLDPVRIVVVRDPIAESLLL